MACNMRLLSGEVRLLCDKQQQYALKDGCSFLQIGLRNLFWSMLCGIALFQFLFLDLHVYFGKSWIWRFIICSPRYLNINVGHISLSCRAIEEHWIYLWSTFRLSGAMFKSSFTCELTQAMLKYIPYFLLYREATVWEKFLDFFKNHISRIV